MEGNSWIIGAKGEVEISYHLDGRLAGLRFSEDATREQILWAFDNAAMWVDKDGGGDLQAYMKGLGRKVKVEEIPPDISFTRFWEAYGNKVSKMQAEQAWQRLSRAERVRVLVAIPKYRKFSTAKGYDLAYPAKFINKRMYEDYQ